MMKPFSLPSAQTLIREYGVKEDRFTLAMTDRFYVPGDIIRNEESQKIYVHKITSQVNSSSLYNMVCSKLNWFGFSVYHISMFKTFIERKLLKIIIWLETV